MRLRRWRQITLVLGALILLGSVPATSSAGATKHTPPQLHVHGNRIVDQRGHVVVLHGVNRSGGEFACVQGNGIWDGPTDQASIDAIKSWNVNVVRVPLNEACWNGESYVDPAYSGENYRSAVRDYLQLLNRNGLMAIVEIHWSDGLYTGPSAGCDSAEATCQKPMPDAAQAIPFWRSVARTFRHDKSVIFDLFNEAYPDRALPTTTEAWTCWRDGGSACSDGISYPVAGMQMLVDTVRHAGAHNVVMMSGLAYANDLTGWLEYEPRDRDHNIVASWHSYNFNACSTEGCWNSQIAPVLARVPVVAGELGENDCADTYIAPLLHWLDARHAGYLAWTWNTWDCSSGPALISDYNGTPTAYGNGYRQHLLTTY